MMKKIIINENQFDTIFEYKGISDSTIKVSKKIEELILDDLKQQKREYNFSNNTISLFNFDFIGKLLIKYTVYYIDDENKLQLVLPYLGGGIIDQNSELKNNKIENCQLNISFVICKNKIITSYFQNYIMHEVTHLYQKYMQLLNGKNINITNLYKLSNDLKVDSNEIISNISKCIYYSHKFEQDAFASQLYSFIMNDKDKPIEWLYNHSETKQIYDFIKNVQINLHQWDDNKIKQIENVYGQYFKTNNIKEYLNKLLDKTLKRYKRKFNNVYERIKEDLKIKEEREKYQFSRICKPLGLHTI